LRVPDGRGKLVGGQSFNRFEERQQWREEFESMRLLYVAATRAQERLIFSGTASELSKLEGKSDTWLKWIWNSLELKNQSQSGLVRLGKDAQLRFTLNPPRQVQQILAKSSSEPMLTSTEEPAALQSAFPLLATIAPQLESAGNRFSVTQLINYQRCRRQYYFDRVLHVPSAEAIAVWNDAEAPEPPANLTATLKGAVIHRFCETYHSGEDPRERVTLSLEEIIRQRQAELADRLAEIDRAAAITELLPLAENYIKSDVFKRVELARTQASEFTLKPGTEPGLWSELSFRLRRPLGVLNGIIDKLLISRSSENDALEIEIIDFKTNRISARPIISMELAPAINERVAKSSPEKPKAKGQIALAFMEPQKASPTIDSDSSVSAAVALVAEDYQLQMQAYSLAVRTLIPAQVASDKIRVTLHFLDPNVEFQLPVKLLNKEICERAIDDAMLQIVSSSQPEDFPVQPSTHCRVCNFLRVCNPGRDFLKQLSIPN
jgi:ATP-dependent exoDNAse (exonuclease V) beta subunit